MACSTSSFAYYSSGSLQANSFDCDPKFSAGTFHSSHGFFILAEAVARSDFYSCTTVPSYPRAYAYAFVEDVDGTGYTEYRVEVSLTGPGTSDYLQDYPPAGTGLCGVFAQASTLDDLSYAYALLTY